MAGLIYPVAYKVDSSQLKKGEADFAKFSKGLKTALAAAGISVGIAATVRALKDAAKAATEDIKSQALLANQLRNTVGANKDQIASVEKSIQAMQFQASVADDEIRPAFASLVRSTGDLGKATQLTALALDVSAGTGRDLGAVSIALGKAVNGSTGSLQKLVPSIKGASDPMGELAKQFKGAAEAASNNDPFQRMSIVLQDMQEQLGAILLPMLNDFAAFLASADFAKSFSDLIIAIKAAASALDVLFKGVSGKGAFQTIVNLAAAAAIGVAEIAFWLSDVGTTIGYIVNRQWDKAGNQMVTYFSRYNKFVDDIYKTQDKAAANAGNYVSPFNFNTSPNTGSTKTGSTKSIADALAAQKKAIADFKTSMADLITGLKPLQAATRAIGQFEQQAIDSIDAISSKIKDALANKTITQGAASVLNTYVTTEGKALAAIAAQRDALAAKRGLAETLIADVKSAVMGFGNITGLLKTTTETVVETQNLIIDGIATTISKSVEKVTANDIVAEYQKIIDKTKAFAKNLKVLKDAGLNQNLFEQIVSAGVDAGGATAEAIIAGGGSTISELNSLFSDLETTGNSIAEQTATIMYGAGVDITQGLINGMKSQEQALLNQAQAMIDGMTLALQSALANLNTLQSSWSTGVASKSSPLYGNLPVGTITPSGTIASTSGVNLIRSVPQFATGGIVMPSVGGSLINVAEAGVPEAIIPLNRLGNMGGSSVYVTVNAGLGTNGASLAKDIVTTIKAYERTNGAVWQSA
jgi:hypothetical protein